MLAVVVLNFLLIRMAPGDPALTIAGEMGGATEEIIADIRREYGLDKSLPEQLFVYMKRMLSGDLGDSLFFNSPVLDLILERINRLGWRLAGPQWPLQVCHTFVFRKIGSP